MSKTAPTAVNDAITMVLSEPSISEVVVELMFCVVVSAVVVKISVVVIVVEFSEGVVVGYVVDGSSGSSSSNLTS